MRTTVTIDDDLLAEARTLAARQHRTIESVLEEALRTFLATQESESASDGFELPRLSFGNPRLRPGIDLYDKEQTAEPLGDNELPRGM